MLLNSEQQQLVDFDSGVVLGLAGPGTGKTFAIASRFARLLRERTDPRRILCLTFTRTAALEMAARIAKLSNSDPGELHNQVSTFHGLGLRALLSQRPFALREKDCIARDSLLRSVIESLLIPGIKASDARSYISLAKRSGVSPDVDIPLSSHRDRALHDIFRRYIKRLREIQMIDFDDMVYEFYRMLKNSASVRERFQRRYDHLIIDEFQDTNHIQQALSVLLAEKCKSVLAVGDYFQSIFAFCGADCSVIENFGAYFPNHKVMFLSENYRSSKNIISTFVKSIRNKPPIAGELLEKLHTRRYQGTTVSYSLVTNEQMEADLVSSKIKQGLERKKSHSSFAILFRTNSQMRPVEQALIQDSIPYVSPGCGFFGRREIKLAVSFLKIVQDSEVKESIICLCHGGCHRCKNGLIESWVGSRILRSGLPTVRTGKGVVEYLESTPSPFSALLKLPASQGPRAASACRNLWEIIQHLKERAKADPSPAALLEYLYQVTGYLKWLEENEDLDECGDNSRVDNAQELLAAAGNFLTLKEFLAFSSAAEEVQRRTPLTGLRPDAVTLSTVHKAKGLEWDTVIVCGVDEGIMPHCAAQSQEEEDRILYVALSRAKNELHIISHGVPNWFVKENHR